MNKPTSITDYNRSRRQMLRQHVAGHEGTPRFNLREFDAAKQSELLSYWKTEPTFADYDIFVALSTLQTRARNEFQNNDYVKRFVAMCRKNIVGPEGFRLKARVRNSKGNLDRIANASIEDSWRVFTRLGNCEVTRRHTLKDIQNIAINGLMIDGELIIRHYLNFEGNEARYAIQFVDPRLLDVTLNTVAPTTKNNIVMGVEVDKWGAPVAYWFKPSLRKNQATTTSVNSGVQDHKRIPAEEITHMFFPEYVVQTRGVPPVVVALLRLNMLKGYEEAELVAARASASKLGFLQRDAESAGQYEGDDEDEEGNVIIDTEPGSWSELPPGYSANLIDPNHPVEAYEKFVKQVLRGIASGLDISYNSLANDLVGVSWSSLRKADLEERDTWRCLQVFLADHLLQEIYKRWLPNALENGALTINGKSPGITRATKFANVEFHPRGWEWVDPVKQEQANALKLQTRQISVSQLIRESGRDPEEVFEEIAEERELMESLGLSIDDVTESLNGNGNGNNQDNGDDD